MSSTQSDRRLARYLLNTAGPDGAISATHQALASKPGFARKFIGRRLKEFDCRGWVSQGRGSVAVTDAGRLAEVTGKDE
ncbi:MAG: helix-turn-helix domain-containing protein [Rhodospirillales bacterium]